MSQPPIHLSDDAGQPRSGAFAAFLSFFVPGLGQIYAGQTLRGVLIAIPQAALILVLGGLYVMDHKRLESSLITQTLLLAGLFLLLLVYRMWAMIDAYQVANRRGSSRAVHRGLAAGFVVLSLLVVVNGVSFGYLGYTAYRSNQALEDITNGCDFGDRRGCASPSPSVGPSLSPGESPTATPTYDPSIFGPTDSLEPTVSFPPTPTPGSGTPPPTVDPSRTWAQDGVLNVLLLGVDEGIGGSRGSGIRTDTMMVLSIDVVTGRSALFGVPRNVTRVPFPDDIISKWACRCFPQYLFGLGTFFGHGDGDIRLADGADDPYRAIRVTIGNVLGLSLDGIVKVNLGGFVKAIDALGGIDVNVPPPGVTDTAYRDENNVREDIHIRAGVQHMDGHTALMFVRSRHQDSDYGRMGRQQTFLRSVRAQLTFCNLIPRLPDLIGAVGNAVATDFPISEFPALIDLVSRSKQPRRFEFTPERGYQGNWSDPVTLAKIRDAVSQGFAATQGNPDPAEPDESLPPPPGNAC
ncbi:MAG: LCP family protein [Candidatus Limnocylindrales bacterium]